MHERVRTNETEGHIVNHKRQNLKSSFLEIHDNSLINIMDFVSRNVSDISLRFTI